MTTRGAEMPNPFRWWRLRAARRERARRNMLRAIRRAKAAREECWRTYKASDYRDARRLLVEVWEWDRVIREAEAAVHG